MQMLNAVLYEETPDELALVEMFARRRRRELLGEATRGAVEGMAETGPSPTQGPSVSIAELVWHNVSNGLRSQEVLKTLPADESDGITPTEMGEEMTPDENGQILSKASVRASILNIRRVEKRLRDEGRLEGRLVQADWSDADGANRYYLRSEDHAVIADL